MDSEVDADTALVHLVPVSGELAGIWLWREGQPSPHYPALLAYPDDPDNPSEAEMAWQYGSTVIASRTPDGAMNFATWQATVEHLARHTSPYLAHWQAVQVPADSSPQAAYEHILGLYTEQGGKAASLVPPTPAQQAAAARAAFASRAAALATDVATTKLVNEFKPGPAMSGFAFWFEDRDQQQLIAVIPPADTDAGILEVLAYGLAWQQDRDLVVVVPVTHTDSVVERTVWIGTPARVWTYGSDTHPTPVTPPPKPALLSRTAPRTWVGHRIPTTQFAWIAPVIGAVGAVAAPHELAVYEQASYCTWQADGMEQFRAASHRDQLTITVAMPKQTKAKHHVTRLTGPATSDQTAAILSAVTNRRAALNDPRIAPQNPEHRLQARLQAHAASLGLVAWIREFPAWRAPATASPRRGGFIDFLGLDAAGDLHIVETKVGSDPRVVLQALDYLTWVLGQELPIRADARWQDPRWWSGGTARPVPKERGKRVVLDFVLAADPAKPVPVGPYLAGQLEALGHEVTWRLWTTTTADPAGDLIERAHTGRATDLWTPVDAFVTKPVTPAPRWAGRVTHALADRP